MQNIWTRTFGSRRSIAVGIAVVTVGLIAVTVLMRGSGGKAGGEPTSPDRPALTVVATSPRRESLHVGLPANGTITAWQEAIIGTESNGLRLERINVDVGDEVTTGQVLAEFAAATVAAELAQGRAALHQAEAMLTEARDNSRRAGGLQGTGALSDQQIQQYLSAELIAEAQREAAAAAVNAAELRLAQARVLAPDNGVISVRNATLGEVPGPGQELFRLIRGGRLEWRAEVAASDLARLRPGLRARIVPAGGEAIEGVLRAVAPTVDTLTRNGMVHVDLPLGSPARAGMFARGEFDLGLTAMMTLPRSAVVMRDGFEYVMCIGEDSTVTETKVSVGRRAGDRIEIVGGLAPSASIVASGSSLLGDGDLVRVVDTIVEQIGETK